MKLPNAEHAVVDPRKLRDYALSPVHPVGRFKAAFFARVGFTTENWESLKLELRQMVLHDSAEPSERTEYGQKYLVRGIITGPTGVSAEIRSVWIILNGEQVPRLVTIYPED
ncbi:MAG: hypothetical protein QOH06_4790 [Acidobacteriota bacterium]|jgi:hypothetical protein|nr:hypothetical protein [Acidobacteriota bacterium]